ncbi:MAG: GNAT family N-acetyltransferase, partial [Acidimicrobiales bacterium]
CFLAYAAELDQRFPEGFDQADLVDPEEIQSVGGTYLVARHHQRTIGCGVLRRIDAGSGEIKHLWVDHDVRGLGVSRLLLAQLEQSARAEGMTVVRLDTHATLTEATNLYRTSGYVEIPPYGANPHAHLWFEKRLAGPTKR